MRAKFKLELLPLTLEAEVLTDFEKPTLVLRGDTRAYREIIKTHGGKYWPKDRYGQDDPRWTVTGDRAIRAVIRALSDPDPSAIKKAVEDDAKFAANRSMRDAFAKKFASNGGATWEQIKGRTMSMDSGYGYDVISDGADAVLYRQTSVWSGDHPLFRVSIWHDSHKIRDVEIVASRIDEFVGKVAAKHAANLERVENAKRKSEESDIRRAVEEQKFAESRGYVVRGATMDLVGTGKARPAGRVFFNAKFGWLMVFGADSQHVTEREIEDREDRDEFGGRSTAGRETHTRAIPVEPSDTDLAAHRKSEAVQIIRTEAAGQRAQAADDFRFYESAFYKLAVERLRRLDAGEDAETILLTTTTDPRLWKPL